MNRKNLSRKRQVFCGPLGVVCLTKIHTATRYLDERRTAYDERSSLKRRDDDVAQGYAAYDGQCRYDEGCDEDQGIVLENRHGLKMYVKTWI